MNNTIFVRGFQGRESGFIHFDERDAGRAPIERGLVTHVDGEGRHRLRGDLGTLWEFDKPNHSCCHGFASHAAVLLVRDVLGVKRIDPVARTVAFEPPAGSPLGFCEAALPTDDGEIEVGWRRRADGTVERRVRLPAGWRER